MAVSLDDGVRRLEAALGLLEAAVTRRLEAERRRGDLETELQIMQDDRARLAVELNGAMARLHRVEAATSLTTREDGPLWYRGLAQEPETFAPEVDKILVAQQARGEEVR